MRKIQSGNSVKTQKSKHMVSHKQRRLRIVKEKKRSEKTALGVGENAKYTSDKELIFRTLTTQQQAHTQQKQIVQSSDKCTKRDIAPLISGKCKSKLYERQNIKWAGWDREKIFTHCYWECKSV